MCLAIPIQIKKISGREAELSDGRKINLALVDKVKAGDWILAANGIALKKLSSQEAEKTLGYFHSKLTIKKEAIS